MITPEDNATRRAVRLSAAGLVLLCAVALVLLFRHIDATMPYPYHADEGFIAGPAANILVKGDLRPPRFNYPSLPTYIAATAMSVGFIRGATHREIRAVSQIGRVGYPYYTTPRVMRTARQAFAVLAVLCLGMTGVSAWLTFRQPATMVLAPLFLLASPLYFRHAWEYLNVDIVGAAFVMLTLATCLAALGRPSIRRSAIGPGVCVGLAAASKYSLGIVALPVLLAVALSIPRPGVVAAWAAALSAMAVAFLAAVPYSLIDIPGFLNGVGYEAFHYASGHAGFAADPGWPQLVYYSQHFLAEFGYAAAALATLGLVLFPFTDWKRAAVLTIFPAGLLWLLTSQRVHFTRNALAIHPFVALFASYALVRLHGWIIRVTAARSWAQKAPVSVAAGAALVMATMPSWQLVDHFRVRTDSRTLARQWVAEHLPPEWAIVIPSELGLDHRGLDAGGRYVKVVSLKSASSFEARDALLSDVPSPAVLMAPHWGADRRAPGQGTADALNGVWPQRPETIKFGTKDVLVNYTFPTAWGDPAFSIVVVKGSRQP